MTRLLHFTADVALFLAHVGTFGEFLLLGARSVGRLGRMVEAARTYSMTL